MNIEVLKSKTALAAVASIIVAGMGVALGDATAGEGLQAGVLSLVALFLRAAVGNVADKAEAATVAAQSAADTVKAVQAKREAVAPVMPAAGEQ